MTEKEKSFEFTGTFVARLGDLGLGNADGIPSAYAETTDAELHEIAQDLAEQLVTPQDLEAFACIDGRHTNQNADGSPAVTRLRRVGGSASNLGTALNGNAPIVETLTENDSFGHKIHVVDSLIDEASGFGRSAHLGGCGGANGEIADHVAIHENPAILGAVKALMETPAVKEYLGTGFNEDLASVVRDNAGRTAAMLEASGWSGQAYVDGVVNEQPAHVEDLEVDHEDEKFHGHHENTVTIVIGDKTLANDDEFVYNLSSSKQVAKALAGDDKDRYAQLLIADIAKHMAVANRLPGTKTPILLLSAA